MISNTTILIGNISKYLGLDKKKISFIEDTRENAKNGFTAKYQIGLNISSLKVYNKVNKKLQDFLKKKHNCKKTKKTSSYCKINSDWKIFGQQEGNTGTLYPEQYEGKKIYTMNHAIQERLLLEPSIFTKKLVLNFINNLSVKKLKGGKLTLKKMLKQKKQKKKSVSKPDSKVNKSKICNKYKDKSIRGTPKNWAYKRCMKQPSSKVMNCKNLPPPNSLIYKWCG